eukprot:CAMPEP_0117482552 /NCGR_PEP_ID=MMETSP0784-20121206/13479_1 /TAXON_ID=39447 /ORGANISM="" /LENGTH=40 /DNA_ID= /DNA_START= /DNA_END= /DNA_ORIENTATION=
MAANGKVCRVDARPGQPKLQELGNTMYKGASVAMCVHSVA